MTVVSTTQDTERLTLTVVAELAAPPSRVWQLLADPRLLERWWGPPTWPATFVDHELVPGGRSHYYMTGPDGEQAHGWWRIVSVDEARSVEIEDGFADETGAPNLDLPTNTTRIDLAATPDGTRLTVTSQFSTAEQMDQMTAMGMVEGLTGAMGQMDEVLLTTV
jgi:uncharacterized protein YndB with AHSA1/START domain